MNGLRKGILLLVIIVMIGLLVCLPDYILAQPPGLPSEPEQTPIDGGLGILAAIGGAYAIKKLRDKE